MYITDRVIKIKFANCNKWICLTPLQYNAVFDRDLLLSKDLGLSTDIYMSLIDPDYPVIFTGR